MKSYLIKQGQSLWQIAKEQHVTLEALLAANPQINDINALCVGDELQIPEPPTLKTVETPSAPRPFVREPADGAPVFSRIIRDELPPAELEPQMMPQKGPEQARPQAQPGVCPYCGALLRMPRPFRRF